MTSLPPGSLRASVFLGAVIAWSGCDSPAAVPVPNPAVAAPIVAPTAPAAPLPVATTGPMPGLPPAVASTSGHAPAGTGHWPAPSWLCRGAVGSVSRNRGGSSITFKIRLAGGGKAAFKPDQVAGSSRFRAELAAYRLSELLGYGRVPPSCERAVSGTALVAAAGDDAAFRERLSHELRLTPAGAARGAAILWVDGIRPLDVRPADVATHPLARELSDMILFDELIGNWDRWSGGNVFTDAAGTRLVLIDNAAAFGPIGPERRARMDAVLDRRGAPSEALVASVRALSRVDVARELDGVGYGRTQIDGVMERRDRIITRLEGSSGASPPGGAR